MTTAFVLIVWFYAVGMPLKVSYYGTKESCEAAAATWRSEAKSNWVGKAEAICLHGY